MKIISIVIISIMIYEDIVFRDYTKVMFNFTERSRKVFMQEKLFWVDMEKGLLNLERIVSTKGIEMGKYRASYNYL